MSATKASGIVAVLVGASASMFSDPTFADEMANPRHHYRHYLPQYHVIEIVEPPYSGVFIYYQRLSLRRDERCLPRLGPRRTDQACFR
jgi:hypothetical protein